MVSLGPQLRRAKSHSVGSARADERRSGLEWQTVFSHDRAGRVLLDSHELYLGNRVRLLQELRAAVLAGGAHLLVTLNVDQVLRSDSDPAFRAAVAGATFRTLDGMPLVVLARLLGAKVAHRNTGADLLPDACRVAHENGWRIAIVGGTPEVLRAAVRELRSRFADADVVGIEAPMLPMLDGPESEAVVRRLQAAGPSISFLCMGSPKQELWYRQWSARLPPGVYIGAGAAVDFAAGARSRAPLMLQRSGMEWIWRLAQEPRRLAWRYLVEGPRFVVVVARSLMPGKNGAGR